MQKDNNTYRDINILISRHKYKDNITKKYTCIDMIMTKQDKRL